MDSLNPYVKADKFKSFEGNTDLVPGSKAIATRRHPWPHARARDPCGRVQGAGELLAAGQIASARLPLCPSRYTAPGVDLPAESTAPAGPFGMTWR